jgi:hypothetical protein
MTFPVDVSRPFRYPSELKRLAEAVRDAGDYDETRWIEWKSTLDLQTQGAIHHIARQILGFANRDPQIAAPWAGGCAYLLIGVSPGQYDGVTLMDPERLVSQIQPYVGADIAWTPESVQAGGVDVLVVIVEPPRPGDQIHVLRKDLAPYRKGAILIRRPGQVAQADDVEMAMLQRRLLSRAEQIAVSVDPVRPSIEVQPDFSNLVDNWSERERAHRVAARLDRPKKDAQPVTISGLFSAGSLGDPRSLSQYTNEVDKYIAECRELQFRSIVHRFARHRPAKMALRITNSCERNFSQVRVTVEVDGSDAMGFAGDLLELMDIEPPRLPSPPAPFGTPMAGRGAFDSLIDPTRLSYNFVQPKVYWPTHDWDVRAIDGGIQRIEFSPQDLRPYETIELTPVPLLVRAEPGKTLSLDVGITATNADGKLDSRITLSISDSTFSPWAD